RSIPILQDAESTLSSPLSLHDALPIFGLAEAHRARSAALLHLAQGEERHAEGQQERQRLNEDIGEDAHLLFLRARIAHAVVLEQDRKSTRLNSSHVKISYAVFCVKKNR